MSSLPSSWVRLRDRALRVTVAGDAALSFDSLSLETLEGACDEPTLPGTGLGTSWGSVAEPSGAALSLLLAQKLLEEGLSVQVRVGTSTAVVPGSHSLEQSRFQKNLARVGVLYMITHLLRTCFPSGPQPKT